MDRKISELGTNKIINMKIQNIHNNFLTYLESFALRIIVLIILREIVITHFRGFERNVWRHF